MNILVSSLSFLSLDTVSRHLQLSNQSILSTISQHSYSAAVFTVRDSGGVSAVINGSINSFCATYYGQDTTPANLAANSLLFVYSNEKSRLNLLQNSRHSEYSCVLVDEDSGTAVISMDAAGAVPLWYTLTDNADGQKQFIVTSDIILGYKLGFNALSAAGPGQTVSFDFRSNEMVSFSHWQGSWLASAHQNSKKTMANAYANTLLASALSVMNSTVRGEGYIHLTTEFDPMDQSTHFLECVLDTLQVDRLVRLRQPLVEDRFVDSSAYIDLLEGLRVVDREKYDLKTWKPSFLRVAADRWNHCKAATAATTDHTNFILVGPVTGINSDPLVISLQNTFCSMQNVALYYPFLEEDFQKALWNTDNPRSYFHQTSDILITSGSCVAPPLFTTTRTVEFQRADDSAFPNYMLSYNSDPENITVIMDDKKVHIPVYSSYSASRSNFYNLWSMAKRFARSDGVITLLVATAGYADLLTNLMCSTAVLSTHNIIVVTQDTDVALLAEASDVGYFIPLKASTFKEYDDIPGKGKTGLAANFADFGTLSYQELILARCESALSLLLMGYAPVISDIDTFWVYDPIKFVMASSSTSEAISYDIAVTDDHGEICGCFVALSSTDRGIKFWEAVIKAHRNMVVAAIESKKDQLKKFTDSEQKILTDLIYGKQYTGDLKVQLLPKEVFPSGFSYFNVRKNFYGNGGWKDLSRKDNPVAIIHNNFIIGKDLKKVRFERHRIWRVNSTDWGVYREPAMSIADCPIGIGALENCSIDDSFPTSAVAMKPVYDFKCEYNPLNNWEFGFNFVNKDVSIPSITIILPMNNAVLKKNVLRLLVLTEGMLRFEQSIRVYLGTESPTKFHIGLTAVYDMQISTNNNNSILSVVAGVENTNLEVSIDIGYDRSSFAYDLSNKFHRFSSSNAISFQTIDNEANNISEIGNVTMSYSIVVLAFKRPISLQRLLKSLYAADYSGDIVKLTIIIDGPRTEEEQLFVADTVSVANSFVWKHGEKIVIAREVNFGLVNQWYASWTPTSIFEATFIFEDDIEVSPYFYIWARRVTNKYYLQDSRQRVQQQELLSSIQSDLKAIREKLSTGELDPSNITVLPTPELDSYLQQHAGKPLLYGLCLQKQHLDPHAYPKKLRIRNRYQPFLYSLIGSWGPMMLPILWQAFIEWWTLRFELFSKYTNNKNLYPLTENIIVNSFFKGNTNIWTPWHVRFAYETGAKCLYSNLPGNLSLVVNHREAGENYNTALGANTKLLSRAADLDKLFNFSGINPINSYAVDAESGIVVESTDFDSAWSEMISHDLELSLSTFPEIKHLSHQQYDLGLRRVGSFGADRTHNYLDKLFDCVVNAETGVLATVVRFCTGAHIPGAAMISNDIINNADAHVVNRLVTTKRSFMRYSQLLSSYHVDDIRMLRTAALSKKQWCYIMDMIESYLLPNSNILSVEISPLIDLSRLKHLGYLNTIVANSQKFCGSLVKRYNLPATDNSFESLVECTTVDEIASNGKFDMAIINLHLSQLQDIDIQKLWTKVAPINYILVLDVCSSAPTEFAVDHRRYDSEANDDENSSFEDIFDQTETSYYVSVDDLCTMGAVDSGAVLFRRLAGKYEVIDFIDRRHALGRRLDTNTMTTEITLLEYTPTFT